MTKYEDLQRQINELEARLDAHAHLNDYLVSCAVRSGQLDAEDLVRHLRSAASHGPDDDETDETPRQAWLRTLATAYYEEYFLRAGR